MTFDEDFGHATRSCRSSPRRESEGEIGKALNSSAIYTKKMRVFRCTRRLAREKLKAAQRIAQIESGDKACLGEFRETTVEG